MVERTCCKTCRKKEGCKLLCDYALSELCSWDREDCYPCKDYEEIPAAASSKPRIVAV